MNVLPGQPVEVHVTKRTTEDCVAPQGTKAFAGSAASKTVPKSKPIAAAPAPKSVTNKPPSEKNANRYGTDEKSPATSAQVGRAASTRYVQPKKQFPVFILTKFAASRVFGRTWSTRYAVILTWSAGLDCNPVFKSDAYAFHAIWSRPSSRLLSNS